MSKHIIDTTEISRALRKVVRDKGGDYVYKDEFGYCEYVNQAEHEPRCIVGHALTDLGVVFDTPNTGLINGIIASRNVIGDLYLANPEIRLTNHAIVMLSAAQAVQDSGGTWEAASHAASGALNGAKLSSDEEEFVL